MTKRVNQLSAWTQSRNALVENLTSTFQFLETEPHSNDPNSAFRKAEDESTRILEELRKLAVAGLRQIDDQIAAGTLVKDIADAAKDAKREADLLKKATKTIAKITKAVDVAAGVVTKIAGLPFL